MKGRKEEERGKEGKKPQGSHRCSLPLVPRLLATLSLFQERGGVGLLDLVQN